MGGYVAFTDFLNPTSPIRERFIEASGVTAGESPD